MIEANPEVVGPVFLNLQFSREEDIRAEMFLNLLARAIDRDRVTEAHPAYGHIVTQLHPDEAVILYEMKKRDFLLLEKAYLASDMKSFKPREQISMDFPLELLKFPNNFRSYFDHLYHLGLGSIAQQGSQEPLFNTDRQQTGVTIRSRIGLMAFGQQFAKACVPDDFTLTRH